MSLRHQLAQTREEELRKLFLSLKSHRINYRMIMENREISPELKMVVCFLLKRINLSLKFINLSSILRTYR